MFIKEYSMKKINSAAIGLVLAVGLSNMATAKNVWNEAPEVHIESIVALCNDSVGRSIGKVAGLPFDHEVDRSDAMAFNVLTINWSGGEFADIVRDTRRPEKALLVAKTPRLFSFVVVHKHKPLTDPDFYYGPETTELYSLYLNADVLLISEHLGAFSYDSEAAINIATMAQCSIHLK